MRRNKCKKMHIGKRPKNYDICKDSKVDAWEDVTEMMNLFTNMLVRKQWKMQKKLHILDG